MTRLPVIAMVAASALASALLTSLIAVNWHQHQDPEHQDPEQQHDFHTWLHQRLKLTDEQAEILQPLENEFTAKQQELRTEIAKAADELAHLISHNDQSDPKVSGALARLNHAQAELQKISLEHFFQMKKELTPEQTREILRWTHDSIVGDHSH